MNIEETKDYMPEMGPMIGYAVTVVCEASNKKHRTDQPNAWHDYRKYVGDYSGGPWLGRGLDANMLIIIMGALGLSVAWTQIC